MTMMMHRLKCHFSDWNHTVSDTHSWNLCTETWL